MKVERIALQIAASIGGLLLTTDAAIVEIKEKKEKKAGAGGLFLRGLRSGALDFALPFRAGLSLTRGPCR